MSESIGNIIISYPMLMEVQLYWSMVYSTWTGMITAKLSKVLGTGIETLSEVSLHLLPRDPGLQYRLKISQAVELTIFE